MNALIRIFLASSFIFCLSCSTQKPSSPVAQVEKREITKPNIVYIVSDDLGWKDVGYHGSDIKTPNIDQLANSGARFEQFYTQPLCTPSRAALMTGRYPFRYGLQTGVILGAHTYGLSLEERLLSDVLRDNGYDTAIVGKWHLGHADKKYWPNNRGFTYQYGPLLGEIDYYTHKEHGVKDWFRNGKRLEEKGYVTQLLGSDAVRVVNQHDTNKPLFLYLSFTAPHAPYQAPQDYIDRYSNIAEPTRRTYAAMITCMDDEIGKVLAALDQKGMRENTIIAFQSDNGGNRSAMFAGEIDVSKLVLPSDNGPYKEGKGTLYEGGTRVVALANWPKKIPASIVNEPVHMVDVLPTLAKITGSDLGQTKPLDGKDFSATLFGEKGSRSHRDEVVYNIEPYRAAILSGKWKMLWRTTLPSSVELYDIEADPSEKNNLADKNPEVVSKLKQRIEELSKEGAQPLFLTETIAKSKANVAAPIIPD